MRLWVVIYAALGVACGPASGGSGTAADAGPGVDAGPGSNPGAPGSVALHFKHLMDGAPLTLGEAGLLDELPRWEGRNMSQEDYRAADDWKLPLLVQAARRFLASEHPWRADYEAFQADAHWLEEAGLYWAIKMRHEGRPWWEWPENLRAHDEEIRAFLVRHEIKVAFAVFCLAVG